MYSPLEQFVVYPILVLKLGFFDISITNQSFMLFFVVFLIFLLFASIPKNDGTLFYIPSRQQAFFEILYISTLTAVMELIPKGQRFFPLVYSLFLFVTLLNIIALIPYCFTVTSHIAVTFALSFSLFIGINLYAINLHGTKMFSLFFPKNISFIMAFFIVPLEFILYFFRPISLATRLFCNLMAGHILLKIFAGFAFVLLKYSIFTSFIAIIPLFFLFFLFWLELIVAFIQSFVFILLVCIYIRDVILLH